MTTTKRQWTESDIKEVFEAVGFTFDRMEGRPDSQGTLRQYTIGTCSEGHEVSIQVGNVRRGHKPVCRTCMRNRMEEDSRVTFDEGGFTFHRIEGRTDSQGWAVQYAVGTCDEGHAVEMSVSNVRSGKKPTCWMCLRGAEARDSRAAFDTVGFTFDRVEGRTVSQGVARQFAVGTCGEGHAVDMRVGDVREGKKPTCWTCVRNRMEADSRAAFDAVGFAFDKVEGRTDSQGKLYQYAGGTCGEGHAVDMRVGHARKGSKPTCWTCMRNSMIADSCAAFDEVGFTFERIEGRKNSNGVLPQYAVGTCGEGHAVEMSVNNVRKGSNPICWTCVRNRMEADSRAAFDAVGFAFDRVEGQTDSQGKLYQYAVGTCIEGHDVSVYIGNVRALGVSCKQCRLAGRVGVVYMAADSSHIYIGQTINLAQRMGGHTSMKSDWSGSLFAKLPRSITARIAGAVTLSDEIGDDEVTVVKRALRACRTASQEPSEVFFTILETGLLPDALDDAERKWIKHLAKQGVPLVNRVHNPQYKGGRYDWEDYHVHAGYAASFLISGHSVTSQSNNA